MGSILSTVADILGILGFIAGLFATANVIKIRKEINQIEKDTTNKTSLKNSKIGGDFAGRDISK